MGKHNGRARKSGLEVGASLTSKTRLNNRYGRDPKHAHKHTTETQDNKPTMQSVIERNDLDELLHMADLAGRDFAAVRGEAVVISTGAVNALDSERDRQERKALEAKHQHRLVVPRRPDWSADMSPDDLDQSERSSFLMWRRDLAALEEQERLVLTPFEKNLEVWRQLWRVLERSDIVMQVVDARDPLRYRHEDLERYCLELDPTKSTVLLLNKADLLPSNVRTAWADYFDQVGMSYIFWSAVHATEDVEYEKALDKAKAANSELDLKIQLERESSLARRAASETGDARIRVVGRDELLAAMEARASRALAAAGDEDVRNQDASRRRVVGLVGYPNVGKSSTINALFGGKKTAVAPTPGKTKHFQTLIVNDSLMLCDCPGLVFPTFAHSKAEMVAAGVIPIDRLTDVRAPVQIVATRVGRAAIESCYACRLSLPAQHEDANRAPTAGEVLRAVCVLRGWVNGSGLPDETKGGRQVMKDYCDGRLLWFEFPPGVDPVAEKKTKKVIEVVDEEESEEEEESDEGDDDEEEEEEDDVVGELRGQMPASSLSGAAPPSIRPASKKAPTQALSLEDAMMFDALSIKDHPNKPKRPDYKFQKKARRDKGTRGKGAFGINGDGLADGAGIVYGKKGGIVRITGHNPTTTPASS